MGSELGRGCLHSTMEHKQILCSRSYSFLCLLLLTRPPGAPHPLLKHTVTPQNFCLLYLTLKAPGLVSSDSLHSFPRSYIQWTSWSRTSMKQASVCPVPSGKQRLNDLRRVSTQGWREPEGGSLKAHHYVMINKVSMRGKVLRRYAQQSPGGHSTCP